MTDSDSMLHALIEVFRDDSEEIIGKARLALSVQHVGEVRNQLHSLKGSAASIGAKGLAALCESAEALTDAELCNRAPALLRDIELSYAEAFAALQVYQAARQR